jgi:pyrimidine operon attenuation protein/uracil phosphoribosyltransferase
MDKKNPIKSEIKTSLKAEQYQNKSVVIVDDVLFSGRTLIYGVHHFLNVPLKQLKTVVLVNRNFKKFPVKADFKGISLSTSMKESVEVIFSTKGDQVQLAD